MRGPRCCPGKLAWWREELNRSHRGEAAHPVARRYPQLLSSLGLSEDYADSFLSRVEWEITPTIPADWVAVENHARDTTGFLTELLTRIGGGSNDQLRVAQELGCFLHHVEVLRNLGRDLRTKRCYVPLEEQRRFGLAPADLLGLKTRSELDQMLRERAKALESRYRQISAVSTTSALGPVVRLSAIAAVLLQELSREGIDLLRQHTSLTPVRKFWAAWRHR